MHHRIDKEMHIILIMANLPLAVQEKINRSEIPTVSELFKKLNVLNRPTRCISSLSSDSSNFKSSLNPSPSAFTSIKPRTPYPYCLKKGFKRFHSKANCHIKAIDQKQRFNVNKTNVNENSTKLVINSWSSQKRVITPFILLDFACGDF